MAAPWTQPPERRLWAPVGRLRRADVHRRTLPGMRVLLVEDEARFAAAVARGLRAEGFEVEVVGDGVEGYWRAKERPYGAIVLDILLPGMNGYVVCRRLRDEQVTTPILMLTAKDGEYDEAEALDLGADDFLRKPFAFVVLVARLRALQRRGGGARPPVLAAGDLRFDTKRALPRPPRPPRATSTRCPSVVRSASGVVPIAPLACSNTSVPIGTSMSRSRPVLPVLLHPGRAGRAGLELGMEPEVDEGVLARAATM